MDVADGQCEPTVKGFMERPENPVAEEPCRCVAGFQCSEINCEYCERIPTCGGGDGLELDPGEMRARGQSVGKNSKSSRRGRVKKGLLSICRVHLREEGVFSVQGGLLLHGQQRGRVQTVDQVSLDVRK